MKSCHAMLVGLLAAATLVACTDDENVTDPMMSEPDASNVADADMGQTPRSDVGTDAGNDAGNDGPRAIVEVDLSDALDTTSTNQARVYQVTEESQLLDGDIAHGQVGDWILENDHARYLIEGDDRVMNPCPYGGNVLDASYKGGGNGDDMVGEVCLFVNAALTLDPERIEVIETESTSAVLAVTGTLAVSDYINIESMISEFVPINSLENDFDQLLPVSVTVYYVLNPDDLGLRVVTAFRNDGDVQVDLAAIHMIMSGGDGRYFNPFSQDKGFGRTGSETTPASVPFVGFRGEESSYLYVPEPSENFNAEVPIGGVSITISGVAAVALGIPSVFNALLAKPEQLPDMEGLLHIPPNEVGTTTHWFYAGDGAMSSMLDEAWTTLGVETTRVTGRVVDEDGNPVSGARVSAITTDFNRTYNQALSGEDGTFAMQVPREKSYEIRARLNRTRYTAAPPEVTAAGESVATGDIALITPARLRVQVKRTDGSTTPARITVKCVGECPGAPTGNELDIRTDRLPTNWAAIAWAGVDGLAELDLAPGDYRVVVSRGFEWSLWPEDGMESGGELVSLSSNDEVTLDAEIEHVVDSSGALSGDFHIHSLPSPDSVVPHIERVKNFVAEGVDVMIATDHDYISDFGPAITALGAEAQVATMSGAEITTSDTGHFNAFPLQIDEAHRRNGSLDWSPGAEPGMEPADIFAWVRDEHPGEQVIQVNHPRGLGLINSTDADPLRGITYAEREVKRLAPVESDPVTGDTRIWDESFTAMEIMTGGGLPNFWAVGRWWLQMIGRGFAPTGTAVTDTHARYSDLGGSPRTFVFVPDDTDTPLTFDGQAFVEAVNAGRAIGSRGPFMRVSVVNEDGETAHLGDTIATNDAPLTLRVELDTPEWMQVDTVDVFMNLRDEILTSPGVSTEEPWTPTLSQPVTWDAQTDLLEVATGTRTHRHWKKTVEIPIESSEDAYVIVVVRGPDSMAPVTNAATPFAFSNPIFLDADGNGYDNPPLADLAAQLPTETQSLTHDHDHDHDALTEETLIKALQGHSCSH